MKLRKLLEHLPILERIHWNPNLSISKITSDSRSIEPGDLFVACRGSLMDGHDFIGQAILAKASAIVYQGEPDFLFPSHIVAIRVENSQEALSDLVRKFYDFPDKRLKLTGVTGTNGKTTTAYLLHRLLREKTAAAYIGTLWYDLPGKKCSAVNTTPPAETLIPLLKDMVQENVQHGILEVSSHALDQRRVHGLEFELALFTQLSQDHLDYHPDMEDYFAAKRRFFEGQPPPRHVITNLDCPYGERILKSSESANAISLQHLEADYRVSEIESSFQGSRFKMHYKNRVIPFQIRLPLLHNVSNVLLVLAALERLGYDPEDFRGALQEIPGIPGRMERVMGVDQFQIFVDYAHTPDAILNVLSQAKELKPKRILTLFGCGGDRDRGKRALMAHAASQFSDILMLTSDNPRSEKPEKILYDMKLGIPSSFLAEGRVFDVLDRRDAIGRLLKLAEPGDVVFILGKGHEDYQILGERKIPFDDRLVVQDFLKSKKRVFFS